MNRIHTTPAFVNGVHKSLPSRKNKNCVSGTRSVCARVQQCAPVRTVGADELRKEADSNRIVVLKCFANHCRSCKGVAPKYNKVAAAYSQHASFLQMDYTQDQPFCEQLGVSALPFFAIWHNGQYVAGEPIAWQNMSKLTKRIADIVQKERQHN